MPRLPAETFQRLTNLRQLHVGLNYIGKLNRDLAPLVNLNLFEMKGCHKDVNMELKVENFADNVKLEVVNITQCTGLTEVFPKTFRNMPFLRILNLRDNGLATLEETVADWQRLDYFDTSGNPLECDCQLAWLNSLLAQKTNLPRPYCSGPDEMKGRHLGEKSAELECFETDSGISEAEKKTVIKVIAGMVAAGVLIIAVFLCCWCTEDKR